MKKLFVYIILMAGVAYAQPGTDLTPTKEQMLDDASNVDNPTALTNFGFSAFTQTLIDDANAGDFLTSLGVSAYAQTLLDDATAAAAATTLGLGTGDSPTFTGGTYTGDLLISGKLNVGNGALDDSHIVNFVSDEDVVTEVMLHLEWNSPTPTAGDSNALLFSMYDSALNETEYSRFRSVIEDPTDGTEDGAMTVDVLNDGVLEQAVLFSHDEIIMNDNGADRNFIVKDNTTAEVLRIQGGNGSIAMDGSTLFVDSANNRVGVGTATPAHPAQFVGSATSTEYIALFNANGTTPEAGQIPTLSSKGIGVQSNGGAYYFGRDPLNNIEFIMGTSSSGLVFGGSLTNHSYELRTANAVRATIDADGIELAAGDSLSFASNSGTWNGATIGGDQSFTGDLTIDESNFILNQGPAGGTTGQFRIVDDYGSQIIGAQYAGEFSFYIDNDTSGTETAGDAPLLGFSFGGQSLYLGGSSTSSPTVQVANGYISLDGTPTISGNFNASGQIEATGQAASTDDSVMTKGLVRDFSSVWGDVYKSGNGETDTNNKLSMVYSGDRFFNFSCYTGTAAGDGQWTTFQSTTFGLNYGSGAKGQLRDSFSYKFKFDSNTVTNTDVDLWLIRGKTPNATLPTASDVCFALKFAGEEDLMIAVYDGVTAHTTTVDVSTINSWFTNLASQQEFMWTWDGTTAKVYGRYRKPTGSGDNDWSVWYTIGSLTPSGMSASTTNLSYAGLHFLQHTPVTCTAYTKNYIIWDLEHTTHVIAPN